MRKKTAQKNYRLDVEAIATVERIVKETGMNRTEVVEASIDKFAATIPGLLEEAKNALLKVISRDLLLPPQPQMPQSVSEPVVKPARDLLKQLPKGRRRSEGKSA